MSDDFERQFAETVVGTDWDAINKTEGAHWRGLLDGIRMVVRDEMEDDDE